MQDTPALALFMNVVEGASLLKTPLMPASTPDRTPDAPVLGLSEPIRGRHRLDADFFNRLGNSQKFSHHEGA